MGKRLFINYSFEAKNYINEAFKQTKNIGNESLGLEDLIISFFLFKNCSELDNFLNFNKISKQLSNSYSSINDNSNNLNQVIKEKIFLYIKNRKKENIKKKKNLLIKN